MWSQWWMLLAVVEKQFNLCRLGYEIHQLSLYNFFVVSTEEDAVVKPLHNLNFESLTAVHDHVVCQKLLEIDVVLYLASLVFRD